MTLEFLVIFWSIKLWVSFHTFRNFWSAFCHMQIHRPYYWCFFFFSCSKPFQPFKKLIYFRSQLPRWSTHHHLTSLWRLGKTQFGTTLHSTNVHYYYLHLIGSRVYFGWHWNGLSHGWGQLHLFFFFGVCFIFKKLGWLVLKWSLMALWPNFVLFVCLFICIVLFILIKLFF